VACRHAEGGVARGRHLLSISSKRRRQLELPCGWRAPGLFGFTKIAVSAVAPPQIAGGRADEFHFMGVLNSAQSNLANGEGVPKRLSAAARRLRVLPRPVGRGREIAEGATGGVESSR